jgi:quinol monooxygenase YgiN
MIIIAGTLRVDPAARDDFLQTVAAATAMARDAAGCLDFAQSADPLEPDRINVFERWESDEDLAAFRALPGDADLPPIRAADVHRYRISTVEPA